MFTEDHAMDVDGIHVCPVCAKMYMEEKAFYFHIMTTHQEGEQLAHELEADLYRRGQNRLPRVNQ